MSMTRAWTAVALLTLVGMINMIDRAMPGVMVEPIKHDLQLSDSALGLVNGFGFLLVYSVMGIPIARLADRAAYGLVISGCIALWSAMTLLGSFVHNGWQLAVTRMGVALGEAGNTPAAHAFVARNFAPQSRAAPLSVLALSVPLAVITAIIGGGLIAALYGWRTTFATMGIAGLVIAPLVLWLLGPRQAPAASVRPAAARPLAAGLALLRKRSFAMIMVASAFIGIGGYALATFAVAFLMRSHGMPLAEVSVHYGLTAGLLGMAGVLGTGALADRLSARDARSGLWLVVALVAALLPCSLAAFLVSDPMTSLVLLAFGNLIGTAYLPPVVATIQRLVPPDMRATASAMLLLFTALAGGIGPLVVGVVSDALRPRFGQHSLGWAMLLVPFTQALAGLFYLLATATFESDLEPAG